MTLRLVVVNDVDTTVIVAELCHALVLSEKGFFVRYGVLGADAVLAQVMMLVNGRQTRVRHTANEDLVGCKVLVNHYLLRRNHGELSCPLLSQPF